jgi:hypothetical protein
MNFEGTVTSVTGRQFPVPRGAATTVLEFPATGNW